MKHHKSHFRAWPDRHRRVFFLLFNSLLIAISVCGCDRNTSKSKPSTKPSVANRYDYITQSLANWRSGILKTTETDQTAIPRIDHISAILRDENAFEHQGYLIYAAVGDDEITGADACFVTGVAYYGQIDRIDLLDKEGNAVLVCRKPLVTWGGKHEKGVIADFVSTFFVAPSSFDPSSAPSTPGVNEGSVVGMEVVKLSPGTVVTDLSARVVFSDGRETDKVKFWKVVYNLPKQSDTRPQQ